MALVNTLVGSYVLKTLSARATATKTLLITKSQNHTTFLVLQIFASIFTEIFCGALTGVEILEIDLEKVVPVGLIVLRAEAQQTGEDAHGLSNTVQAAVDAALHGHILALTGLAGHHAGKRVARLTSRSSGNRNFLITILASYSGKSKLES